MSAAHPRGDHGDMTAKRMLRILIATASVALLAACATGAPSGDGDGGTTGGTGGGTAAGCEVFDAYPEAVPFQSDLIASAPASGAVWGDGTPFTIQLSDEAIAADLLPQIDFLTVVNGGLQLATSQIFDDNGDGSYTNQNNVFDETLDGQPGIAQVNTITDASFDGEKYDGNLLVLGNYCITFKL